MTSRQRALDALDALVLLETVSVRYCVFPVSLLLPLLMLDPVAAAVVVHTRRCFVVLMFSGLVPNEFVLVSVFAW